MLVVLKWSNRAEESIPPLKAITATFMPIHLQDTHPFVRLEGQSPIWVLFYHFFGESKGSPIALNRIVFIVAGLQKQVIETFFQFVVHG